MKDYNTAYAKTSDPRARIQYVSLTGALRYRLVLSYADWAELDAPSATMANADLARALARIRSCYDSSTTVVTELLPDLSTTPNEPPVLLRRWGRGWPTGRTRARIRSAIRWEPRPTTAWSRSCRRSRRTVSWICSAIARI